MASSVEMRCDCNRAVKASTAVCHFRESPRKRRYIPRRRGRKRVARTSPTAALVYKLMIRYMDRV